MSSSRGRGGSSVEEARRFSERGRGYVGRGRGGRGRGFNNSNQPRGPRLTHFLCIPLINATSQPQLDEAMVRFNSLISEHNMAAPAPASVPKSAIRPVGTIHLTLGVMSLDADGLARAVTKLQSLDLAKLLNDAAGEDGVKDEPLKVSLKGLTSMHDVSNTSVLYVAPKDASGRLQTFAESLQREFTGLLKEEGRALKLHATIVNTTYSKRELGTVKRLDAAALLALCDDFEWTNVFRLDRVAICEMGAKPVHNGGVKIGEAYQEVAVVSIPV